MHHKYLHTLVLASLVYISPVSHSIAMADDSGIQAIPTSISTVYSDIDMKLRLATKKNMDSCAGQACEVNHDFDNQVQNLGAQLAQSAYEVNPDLANKISDFEFVVVDKLEAATASNAKGRIVIFRGLQNMALSDEALNFIIAREMGHVIAHHHDKNTSTKLIITALASVVFPALAVVGASSTAAQASTATSVLTSAASSVTSLIGSEVAMIKAKPSQLAESDEIAFNLLDNQHYDFEQVLMGLPEDNPVQTTWLKDLQQTKKNLAKRIQKREFEVAQIQTQ